jgi:excisionase family DNA binding protein
MIYRLLKQGELPAFKFASDWRFNRENIDAWVKKRQAIE